MRADAVDRKFLVTLDFYDPVDRAYHRTAVESDEQS